MARSGLERRIDRELKWGGFKYQYEPIYIPYLLHCRYLADYVLDTDQRRLVISNPGLPLATYQSKRSDMEATFDFLITNIAFGKSSKIVKIDYRKKAFPKIIHYDDFIKDRKYRSYEFNIGLALNGYRVEDYVFRLVHEQVVTHC